MAQAVQRFGGLDVLFSNAGISGYATTATGAPPDVAARIFDARIPLARHACADEIAHAVLYLACSASSFVTGATLPVDGGMHI